MKLPRLRVECEGGQGCKLPVVTHPAENVAWHTLRQQWLCKDCWAEGEAHIGPHTEPLIFAYDALPDRDEQWRRLIATAAKRRVGGG